MFHDLLNTQSFALQQACQVSFWSLHLETGTVDYGPAWPGWLGLDNPPRHLNGWLELFHPEEQPGVRRVLSDPRPLQGRSLDARLCHCSGQWRRFRFKGGRHGSHWLGLAEPILLRRSEELYRGLYENSTEHLFSLSVDENGIFRYEGLNPAHQRATGLREEDLRGKRPHECLPPEVADHVAANYQRCLDSGQIISYEEELRLPNGRINWLTQLIPLRDQKGRIYRIFGICTDLTRLKDQEKALRLAQRQESIGRLTAGIAHDFNNLLTVIICQLDLMELEILQNPQAVEALDEIGEAARRAGELTRGLLNYTGRSEATPRPVVLAARVTDFQRLLKNVVSSRVELAYRMETRAAILAVPVAIDQVLLNLVGNASEALGPRGGRIQITVSELSLTLEAADCLLPGQGLADGDYVTLEVLDNGPGVDPSLLERIFEAGISSKGEGRGLGLATVREIVHSLKGGLLVQSEYTRGTLFKLFFPRVAGVEVQPDEPVVAGQSLSGHALICSEELALRRTLRELCEQSGLSAQETSNAAELLTLLAEGSQTWDMLVLDVLDKWSQDQVLSALHALGPGPPVLLMSHLPAGELLLGNDYPTPSAFLHKPFERLQFESAAARLLNRCSAKSQGN
ncbi:MAG: ATP-binding protein [Vulcanimicrobiota bacterium]